MRRALLLLLASSVVASTVGPSSAARSRCRPFKPVLIKDDEVTDAEDALGAPVLKITDKATERKPLTLEYDQETGAIFPAHQGPPIVNSTEYFNMQVLSKKKRTGLHIRTEWATPSASDIDIYLFDGSGENVAASEATNGPADEVFTAAGYKETGGPGFESIAGAAVSRCEGFTFESLGSYTTGETVTLKIWLGPIDPEVRY